MRERSILSRKIHVTGLPHPEESLIGQMLK
jgi:hypothetical protein